MKPRTNASAIGIRKIEHPDALWPILDELGDLQSHYLLERFIPGEIFHVEGITWNGRTLFASAYKYGKPPCETMHQGGVFSTARLDRESSDTLGLIGIHTQVIESLGLISGVTHTEFIKAHSDGRFYFLETAARVGGAHIAEVVEFASGINPWIEWARIEVAALFHMEYTLPKPKQLYAGSVICLARRSSPTPAPTRSRGRLAPQPPPSRGPDRLRRLGPNALKTLVTRVQRPFLDDFCAVVPAPDKPTA